VSLEFAQEIIASAPGLELLDNPAESRYPTPLHAAGNDAVYVGRLRRDRGQNSLAMFIVADNLRKGAATNAVQIAELLLKHNGV
jgi:aspartate-semialdehyde dehydrogenase